MREIDLVVVKGKTQPVAIHEILDYHTEETYPRLVDALGEFRDGLRALPQARLAIGEQAFSRRAGESTRRTRWRSSTSSAAATSRRTRRRTTGPGVWVMESK